MDESAIEKVWAEGAAMSLEEAVKYGHEVGSAALAEIKGAAKT